jgi:hypothetical protein
MGGLSSSPTSSSLFPPAAFFLFFEAPPAFILPVSNPPFGFPGPPAPLYMDEGVFACDGVVCADDGVGESYTSAISTSHILNQDRQDTPSSTKPSSSRKPSPNPRPALSSSSPPQHHPQQHYPHRYHHHHPPDHPRPSQDPAPAPSRY